MPKLKTLLQSKIFYLLLLIIIVIYTIISTKIIKYTSIYSDTTTELSGKLISYNIDGDKLTFLIKNKEKVKGTYIIKSEKEKIALENNLKIGVTIYVKGNKTDNLPRTIPNTFDYKNYLYNEKIYFTFKVNYLEITNAKLSIINNLRNIFDKRIKDMGDNSYLKAFILGEKTSIEESEWNTITNLGISHLFALSGMHLSLIYLLLSKILKKFKKKKLIIYPILCLYLMITGFSISFLRAILFMFMIDLNKYFKLNLSNIKVLFLTAFIIILINPFYIYNIGFWYTFIVTFSLIFTSNIINNQNKIKTTILISIITFLFSIPITIYMNYEINLSAIINNIIFVPFISAIVFPLAIFTFIIPFIYPIFNFSINILNLLNNFLSKCSLNLIVGKIEIYEIIIYYILLILLIKRNKKRYLVLLIILGLFSYHKNIFDNNYHVYYLDVGQGDSSLLVSPQNKEVILIDTGGITEYQKENWQIRNKNFDLSKNILIFLKSIRVRKIDLLVITHGDLDHLGYSLKIRDNMSIKNVMLNKGEEKTLELAIKKRIKENKNYQFKYFKVDYLNNLDYQNENDNSIIMNIKINNYHFLFMGDASIKVEKDLLNKNIDADFLKLGHHGSKTSSSIDFLKKVSPKLAIISSGRNNKFNHPHQEVITNLNNLKINYLNTQDKGTIHLIITKNKYNILTSLS